MVTLSGFAGTIEDIAMAGRLAGGIDGVRAVTNVIRVAT
jgi:osmotically-inducible protein OsmY